LIPACPGGTYSAAKRMSVQTEAKLTQFVICTPKDGAENK